MVSNEHLVWIRQTRMSRKNSDQAADLITNFSLLHWSIMADWQSVIPCGAAWHIDMQVQVAPPGDPPDMLFSGLQTPYDTLPAGCRRQFFNGHVARDVCPPCPSVSPLLIILVSQISLCCLPLRPEISLMTWAFVNFFLEKWYYSTFVVIWQLVSNHSLIRLKRFVSWISSKLCN
jgi:hypothetical protein